MAKEYGIIALPSNKTTQNNKWEMGYRFTVGAEDIRISGLRVYLPVAQTVTANLWGSSSTALASVEISAIANEWCEGLFQSPVTLTHGETYAVTCYNTNNRFAASASNAQFNPKISYVTGLYGSTRGAKPTGTENNQLYPFVDIIIGQTEYKASGTAILSLANYTVGGDDSICWTAITPTGTSVAVSTSVNNGAWQSIANAGTIQGLPARGQACNLRIKIDLATTDVTQTPSVSSMIIQSAEDRKFLVITPTMPNDLRGAVGNISVSYDGLGGLAGTGGPSAAFVGTFTPSGMTYHPNPYVEEHIEVSASANVVLTAITYHNTQETEHVEVSVAATVTLTDIHDL